MPQWALATATIVPVAVLLIERDFDSLAALYAIGVVGAVALNCFATGTTSAEGVKRRERVMLGLRLDEPLTLAGLEAAVDERALDRLEALGLATRNGRETISLTSRGRFLGGGVTAELLA